MKDVLLMAIVFILQGKVLTEIPIVIYFLKDKCMTVALSF